MIDALYRWVFKHSVVIVSLLLFFAGATYYLTPIISSVRAREKLAFMTSEFRNARAYFYNVLDDSKTMPLQYPKDIFARYDQPCELMISSGTLILLSVGPDGKSDAGLITYDPTNGVISRGDLITTLARNLRYTLD